LASLLLPALAAAAEWEFDPSFDVGASWTDNVALAADGFDEAEWITEVRPGISVSVDGPRLSGTADYQMQILSFDENSDLDDVFNQFNGFGSLVVLPDSGFIDAYARYDQLNVDTEGQLVFSNFFTTDNRTDFGVAGVTPYHQGKWGNWGESLVRVNYYGIRYRNVDVGAAIPPESNNLDLAAYLGSPDNARGFSWRGSGTYNFTDFDGAENFRYAQTRLDGGVPVGNRTRLTATVGAESDVLADQTGGGLDETLWYVGFEWEPSARQNLQVRGGDRFYGTAWEASWLRRGSRGDLSVDYRETPTTSAGIVGDDSLFLPGFATIDIGSLDGRAFLLKRMTGRATYELTRSALEARVYSDRRDFLDAAGGQQDALGFTILYGWEATTRTLVGVTVNWEQREFDGDRQNDFGEVTLRVTRTITRIFSAELRLSHFLRNSNFDVDYSANLISLFVLAQFGGESAAEL
jgi:hypothetical protein